MLDREKLVNALKEASKEYTNLYIDNIRKIQKINENGANLDEIANEMERFETEVGTVEDFMADKVVESYGNDYKAEKPMDSNDAIMFAGLMEDFLNVPSLVCELIEKKLTEGKYEEVIRYIIERKKKMNKAKNIS
jgi:hypothetical protein